MLRVMDMIDSDQYESVKVYICSKELIISIESLCTRMRMRELQHSEL